VTEILASHGNNHLSGDDFDAKLVEQVTTHLAEHAGIDPSADRSAMARIVRACETAKIALSDAPFARIECWRRTASRCICPWSWNASSTRI